MKNKMWIRISALLMCMALLLVALPLQAFAEPDPLEEAVSLTAGEVVKGFAEANSGWASSDSSVAWVDEDGNLNAMRAGLVTLSKTGGEICEVKVAAYDDGSDVVGRLKLLARFNDSMPFYDGHVYLLFTSYQDGVDINVDDLYGAYEISDQYYEDLRKDISYGSNHTGTDADQYFTFNEDLTTMTLDRGEIVTIGMYRDFDLTVPQAALGSLQNASAWSDLSNAGKAVLGATVLQVLGSKTASPSDALAKLKEVAGSLGKDYNKLIDGVVDGGVCFNRELYNQKLEWDQYENVTYELDITRDQLDAMAQSLQGNLNKFSILKNSCATVALKAWNAAVGTRDGAPTAYYLDPTGEGIFALIDAPKTVKDAIVNRLPGHCLNNAQGVEGPDAGYQDDTGWVYVSAPAKVNPLEFVYEDDALVIDEDRTSLPGVVRSADKEGKVSYARDQDVIPVKLVTAVADPVTTLTGVELEINGTQLTLDEAPEKGIWLKTQVPEEDGYYYVTDSADKALPSVLLDGEISFLVKELPATFKIVKSETGTVNLLDIQTVQAEAAGASVSVYTKTGEEKAELGGQAQLSSGTTFYVKAPAAKAIDHLLVDVTLNGESLLEDYDETEGAYVAQMPGSYSVLKICYKKGSRDSSGRTRQVFVGDELSISDLAGLYTEDGESITRIDYKIFDNDQGILTDDGNGGLVAAKEGVALLTMNAQGSDSFGTVAGVQVLSSYEDYSAIHFETLEDQLSIEWVGPDGEGGQVPSSGYLVPMGSTLTLTPTTQGMALSEVKVNLEKVPVGSPIVTEDVGTLIEATLLPAEITGMPATVTLATQQDSYQLKAAVRYSRLTDRLKPVYDKSIRYESSDALVKVDETGKLTVTGEIPQGGKAVVVTATAGSSNDQVKASTRVILGEDYEGSHIVGRLTISSRPILENKPVAHTQVTFLPYEDTELLVSCYEYYEPNQKYIDLLQDYEDHPEKYSQDPALYDESMGLDTEVREGYFNRYHYGNLALPRTISLKKGQAVSLSNYSHETTNLETVIETLDGEGLKNNAGAQALLKQMLEIRSGHEVDEAELGGNVLETLAVIVAQSLATGYNPADGSTEGGIDINREMFNQFRRSDSQVPNNYYTVEITADELASLQAYLSNPANNDYSLFNLNCATAATNMWNAALADEPSLQLEGKYTGLGEDPQSLYMELGLLKLKPCLRGEAGVDFYPRWDLDPSGYPLTVSETQNGQVSVSSSRPKEGEKVVVTVLPDPGYDLRFLGVTDDDYNDVEVTKETDGTYSFIQTDRPLTVRALFWKNPFEDVEKSDFFYDAVMWTDYNGFVKGTDDTHFSPKAPCTRGQLVTILWRMADCPEPEEGTVNPFTDVREGKYYHDAVLWALQNSLTTGVTETTFAPDRPVTRAEAVTFLYRQWGDEVQGSNPFTDVQEGKYYYQPVLWAVANGITNGKTETTFEPGSLCTRGEIVTFLYRAIA